MMLLAVSLSMLYCDWLHMQHPDAHFQNFCNNMYCKQLTLNKVIVSKNYHMAHMHAKMSLCLCYMMLLTFLTLGFH